MLYYVFSGPFVVTCIMCLKIKFNNNNNNNNNNNTRQRRRGGNGDDKLAGHSSVTGVIEEVT